MTCICYILNLIKYIYLRFPSSKSIISLSSSYSFSRSIVIDLEDFCINLFSLFDFSILLFELSWASVKWDFFISFGKRVKKSGGKNLRFCDESNGLEIKYK